MKFQRITVDPQQMGGVPCIRNLRIPVTTIVKLLAEGLTETAILELYPDLVGDDLKAALAYAASAVEEREIQLIS